MAMVPWRKREDWDPFRELENLHRNMNLLFDSSLARWPDTDKNLIGGFEWGPSVDVQDKKDKILVKAELPGLEKDDVEISLENNTLILKGEKKKEEEKEDKDEKYYCRECLYGKFQRAITLPAEVKEDEVEASYKNGVLKIILPKKEEAKPKQINIDIK